MSTSQRLIYGSISLGVVVALLWELHSANISREQSQPSVKYERLYLEKDTGRLFVVTHSPSSAKGRLWFRVSNDSGTPLSGNVLTPGGWLAPAPQVIISAPASTGLMVGVDSDGVPEEYVKVAK